ncbi:autophagy-related protein 9A [Zophobas morio]|uniref:autophagy-related protein 9A n=1 Tax=Zophobas morio TaxID=2755281 RepID=UPI003082F6ED
MQNYSSLQETHEPDEEGGVLVHVAEPSRARWNHIEDLDSFFSRMYQYHQRHGFFCMLLQEVLELIQFVFIVFLTAYIFHGIDYPVLFKDEPPHHGNGNSTKVTLHDVVLPFGQCVSNFTALTWIALIIAFVVWVLKSIRGVYHLFHFWDIKQFYNTALKVDDHELDNLTWHEIQTKVRTVQMEQQMCIHKRELSELDIYHRILRQQNYLVAMVNKRLLPPRLNVPFLGEIVYWTAGLRLNIQLLFFWSPWSPFEHPWHLREEYKKPNLRHELANQFGKHILWLAVANLVFAPIIFLWQILYAFFSYAAVIRKEPSILAIRRWSLYGRLYLRHFNELEHELQARLTRAHRPATKYLAAFSSPLGTIISENIGFYATAFLAVFVGLSLIDEDVLAVEHVLTIMTALTVAVAVLRTIAPDETTSQDLEDLLTKVMVHTHYLPTDWSGQAHTARVRKEFEQLFQYGFVSLLETILSPLLTPYILWRHVYPRSIEIVDFFRNFTVSVVGVGDVCSFAQMDVRKHGNPEWHEEEISVPDQYSQCEDGKVEMSLVHFKCTNPSWKPPEGVQAFVKNVQNQSSMIASLSNQDPVLNRLDESLAPGAWRIGEPCSTEAIPTAPTVDVPLYTSGIWRNRVTSSAEPQGHGHMSRMWTNEGISPMSIREMALNATYLHSIHSNRTENRVRNTAQETTPLLLNR